MTIFPIEFATPEYDEAVRLRYDVLRQPLGLVFTPEQLAAEYDNFHIAAYDQHSRLVGYLNLTPVDAKSVKMRQVAVAPMVQKSGVGTALVQYAESFAAAKGFHQIELHARDTAIPFYLRLGYSCVGEPFEEVSIPHMAMHKIIS
jgi:predicted GNAT family N-acyltransferase